MKLETGRHWISTSNGSVHSKKEFCQQSKGKIQCRFDEILLKFKNEQNKFLYQKSKDLYIRNVMSLDVLEMLTKLAMGYQTQWHFTPVQREV